MNTFIFERSDTFRTRKTKRWFALLSFCFMLFMGQMGFAQYCSPSSGDASYEWITNVTFAGISNSTGGSIGLNDYTAQIATVDKDLAGQEYTLSVSIEADSDEYVYVFIDWNQNGVLNDPGETYALANGTSSNGPFSTTVTVPAEAVLGSTMMRVYVNYDGVPTPCTSPEFGEIEDYTVTVLGTPPSCPAPTGLTADVTATSADLGWTGTGDFDIKWGASGFDVETEGTLVAGASNPYNLGGLTTDAAYQFYVRQDCDGDFSDWAGPFSFVPNNFVSIGTGVNTNTDIPVYTYWGYNASQQIVTASELGNPGTKQITKIRWYVDGNANLMSSSDNWQVYLGNTTKTDFTSNTDWVLAGDMTQVFSGTVTAVNASWMEITLSSTFVYTGDNLVVAVSEVESGYAGSYSANTTFGSYTSANNTGIYIRNDSSPYNFTNSPGTGTRTNTLARLQIELSEPPSCLPPTALTAANLTYSSANLGWTSDAEQFDIKWGTPGFDVEEEGALEEDFVSGATLSGLDAETTYEFYVRQNCGEEMSDWAGPYSFYTGYCVPATTSGTSYGITGVSTSGGYTNISNLNSGFTSGGYSDQTVFSVSQSPGEQINYSVSVPGYTILEIWIDLNQNLVFDTEELVANHAYSSSVTTFNGVLDIPEELSIGEYRIRVRSRYYWNTTANPCGVVQGETEDYTLSVVAPPTCFPPTDLAATPTSLTGADISWTASEPVPAEGYVYAVTTSLTAPESGTSVVGTSASVSDLISNTTYYLHVRANCGEEDYSDWVTTSFWLGYCIPTGAANNSDEIMNFTLNNLNNDSAASEGTAGYMDYSGTVAPAQLPAGVAAIASLTSGSGGGNHGAAIWIDYDQNGTFDDSEKVAWIGNTIGASATVSFPAFTVPAETTPGIYRLRVMYRYNVSGEAFVPCVAGSQYAEIEDYAVQVLPLPSCLPPSNLTISNLTYSSADLGWTSDGEQFDIKWGTPGFDVETEGTLEEDFENGATLSGLDANTTYAFYVRNNCGVDGLSDWAGPYSFYTGYCVPTGTSNSYRITGVSTSGGYTNISNLSNGTTNPYNDYTYMSVTQSPGESISYSVTVPAYSGGLRIWVDLNQDLIFDEDELVATHTTYNVTTLTGAINIPEELPLGNYRIRIRSNYSSYTIPACGDAQYGYGEAEDYTLSVVAPPTCFPPADLSATNITTNSADLSWTSDGEQFDIKWGTPGFDVEEEGTLAEDFENGGTLSGLAPQTTYHFYVRNNCGVDDLSAWVGPVSFTTLLANDNIENAIPVSCGETYTGSTATATNDQPNPAIFGVAATLSPNVWYSYTGSGEPELITASLCNSGFDTSILIATGTPGDLTWVAGNEDFCGTSGFRSQVEFASDGTTTYYIMVRGYGVASTGTYELVITCQEACSPATTNDEVADAEIVILGTPLATNNTCATSSPQSYPTCGSQYATYYDSWYTFNSGDSGDVNVVITPEVDVTVGFAVYSGTPASLTQVVCTTTGASINFTVIQNTDYYVRAFSTTPSTKGEFTLSVSSICNVGEWIGGTSTAWNTASNWCGGVVPDSTTDVVISSSNPAVISTDITVNSITLGADASLTVASNTSLTTGDITVANGGSFVIENNANLFQTAGAVNTGDVAVKRNSSLIKHLDYTLWSSPVAEQGLKAFSPQTIWYRIYTYNTTSDQWGQVFGSSEAPDTDFEAGVGYMFRAPNNFVTTPYTYNGEFTGTPNNGNVTVNFDATDGTYQGIGNPYPSNIKIDGPNGFWDTNSGTGTLYFWTNVNPWDDNLGDYTGNNWATFSKVGGVGTAGEGDSAENDASDKTPTGIIPVGQGFVIESGSENSVTFTNDMRTSDAGVFFKMLDQDKGRLWLDLSEGSQELNQVLIGYVSGASQGYDFGYDSEMFGYVGSALYSLIGNNEVNYTIQGRALPFDDNDEVPLGFRANNGGSFTISLNNFDGLFIDENQDIFLKDNLTGEEHNLKNDAYSFVSEEGTFNSRFSIVYKEAGSLNVSTPDLNNNWVVFKQNEMFRIQTQGFDMSEVTVYDILGRVVYTSEAEGNNHMISRIDANQVLIVKVTTSDNQVLTKKVNN
ncbi:MAG: GEVED domain-containing protein [Flavobacteriaceae bacterium]